MPVRWTFHDPVTLDDYEFAINPSDGGSPSYRKSIQKANTTAPDGKVLLFEGVDEPQEIEISGTILVEAHLNAFITWFDKRYQIEVTDDLLRTFKIYITSFEPRRKRSALLPYKHEFTMRYIIVEW